MLAHLNLFPSFFVQKYRGLQMSGTRETEKVKKDIVYLVRQWEGVFLNVTVILKVCPRSAGGAAPERDCGRIIAASNRHTLARTISICHLDCLEVSKRIAFILNVVSTAEVEPSTLTLSCQFQCE